MTVEKTQDKVDAGGQRLMDGLEKEVVEYIC